MAMPKKWRSSIFKKNFFPAENAENMPEKPVFGHFLEISSFQNRRKSPFLQFFIWLFSYISCSIFIWLSSSICRNSTFLQIFIGLFPYISLFFHSKKIWIIMPTIKHGSIVNKTYFWSRNFPKIAGTADFRRKKINVPVLLPKI